jgi:hypothetical protein
MGKDQTCPIYIYTSGLYLEVTFFYIINEWLHQSGLYKHGGRYSGVVFNTGLSVY